MEDESVVALDLKLQLRKLGYEVSGVAGSGEEAVELVAQGQPDIILMDVRLRGQIDGIQAAERIRRNHDVPVIFLTSHSDDETVQRAAQTAPYGYLTKPYQIKELRAGIEVALTKARIERQLRESDQWFAHTLRCVDDGVVLTDLEGCVRFVNPAAERLTGWRIDDSIGRSLNEIATVTRSSGASDSLTDQDIEPMALVRQVISGGRPTPTIHAVTLTSRDGIDTVIDETAGPVDDGRGKRLGAVLILRDATERMAHEAMLRASEERFRGAFDNAPLGMALVSFNGEFIQVNAALCQLLGTTADELKRQSQASLASNDDRAHETRRLSELMRSTQGVVQFEQHYRRLDSGEPIPTLVSVSLMREGNQPTCHLYQVYDLTEQRKAARHLAELAEERMRRESIEMASKAKSEFLSRASHEMRTPLNAVIGFAQLLEFQQGSDPAKTTDYAKHIKTAGEHLLHLVTDVLDLNSAAQGTLKMSPKSVDVLAAINEAVQLLEPLSTSHGVDVRASGPPDLTTFVDPTRLRQILLNLGSNAIKYNRQGGEVRFQASHSPDGRMLVIIEDTGIGMTREQMERLYQPFDRLGQERTKIPGVGLGLVIAKGLVGEMGGDLEITSQPRRGTTVTIYLPAPA
ncbi:PAS domain S-box protein [Pseudaquabacterium pictum]|uniref:PAS domain S-box protein n=1 Tax=Pseudaquabacterium pictum TaxID=2315236 RepID=UPI0013969C53|nr:PAS domain S-box protein [Rubrivivax pictus]